jgi:hypothetical protein
LELLIDGHKPVRSAFTAGLKPFLELLSNVIPGRSKAVRRRRAIATMAEMMILARAVDDEILSATSLNLSEALRITRSTVFDAGTIHN